MISFRWPMATIPRVAVAGRFRLDDHGFETRYRGATHALHVHGYTGRWRLDGVERPMAPGDVTLSPAGLISAYDLKQGGWHWCVHFHRAEPFDEALTIASHQTGVDNAAWLRERIAHIAALHARSGESRAAAVSAGLALQELLLALAMADRVPTRSSATARAAAIIDARFAEPLTVPLIAAEVGRTQSHLARAFRAAYGVSIAQRLIGRRIDHARYLLESTDLPMWRIAERVGIPDAQHFNKTVRRLLGRSPSAIRAGSAMQPIDADR
jgi:AraC-like DNA-binding protein